MPFWTIEEVADHLGLTVTQVRESRRKGEWPGNLGKLRGRRLMFNADLVQAGPQLPETTEDVSEAILWTLVGIESKLDSLVSITREYAKAQLFGIHTSWPKDFYATTTTGDEEE